MIFRPARAAHETRNFNATTSTYDYGSNDTAFDSAGPQTVLCLIRPTGAGEGNFGYVLSRVPSASTDGMRLFINHNSGSPTISYGQGSTVTANAPLRVSSTGIITYGAWRWMAATFDGSLNATGIKIFSSDLIEALTEATYGTTTNGSGALRANSGQSVHVGNRTGTDRTFAGDIALVAWWSVELSPTELERARRDGPLSVRQKDLVLLWAGGQDMMGRNPVPTAATGGQPIRYPIKKAGPSGWRSFGSGLAAVLKDADIRWNVLSAATKDVDLRWNVLNAAQKDADIRWGIVTALQKDADLRWDLVSAILKDVDIRWDIQSASAVVKDIDVRWDVLASLLKDADFRWNVLQAVQKDSSLIWNLLAAVSKDADLRWDILSSLTSVSKDVDLRWNLVASAVKDLTAQWNVLSSVTKDESLIWNIAVAAVRDIDLRWDISAGLASITKDATFMWAVMNAAQKDITLQWVIQTVAGPEVRSRYIYVLPEEGRVFVLRPENFH